MYPQYSATTTATVFDAVADELKTMRNVPEFAGSNTFTTIPAISGAEKIGARSLELGWPLGEGRQARHQFSRRAKANLAIWVIRTTANVKRPGACWRSPWGLKRINTWSPFNRVSAAASGCSRTPRRPSAISRPTARAGRCDLPRASSPTASRRWKRLRSRARRNSCRRVDKQFHYIACLNESPEFIAALTDLVQRQMQGWPVASTP